MNAVLMDVAGRQRILSLWFPHLSTDRILRRRCGPAWRLDPQSAARQADPLVLTRDERGARRVAGLCKKVQALGLAPGMGLADALAMHPRIEVIEADPAADMRMMRGLADWCDRYTPLVALDGTDGLFLDITGCAHLLGGERALVEDLQARLLHHGFDVRAGLAGTPGAAWAVAHYRANSAQKAAILTPGEETDALRPLPLVALRLEADTVIRLESVGLRTIDALLEMPRAPLARRFGCQLLQRLDQAMGWLDEPVSPRLAVPALSVERRLAEPVTQADDIERLAAMLGETLKVRLEEHGEGARSLELVLFRTDGEVQRMAVGMSRPVRDPGLVRRLFRERLANEGGLDAGCGYELIRLSALATAPFDERQSDFGHAGRKNGEDLAGLIDRIHARLGPGVVLRPVTLASHLPERAVRHIPFDFASPPQAGPCGRPRPTRLFSRPEPIEAMAEIPEGPPRMFRWRRALYRIQAAEGPERLEPEWWREEEARTRDYYRVEDLTGRRFWLYRQGLYTEGDSLPRWFLHGLFA